MIIHTSITYKIITHIQKFLLSFSKLLSQKQDNGLLPSSSRRFPISSQFFSLIWVFTASNFIGIETRLDCFRFFRLIGIKLFLFFTITSNVFDVQKIKFELKVRFFGPLQLYTGEKSWKGPTWSRKTAKQAHHTQDLLLMAIKSFSLSYFRQGNLIIEQFVDVLDFNHTSSDIE